MSVEARLMGLQQQVGSELGSQNNTGRIVQMMADMKASMRELADSFSEHVEQDRKSFYELQKCLAAIKISAETEKAVLKPWMILGGLLLVGLVNAATAAIVQYFMK